MTMADDLIDLSMFTELQQSVGAEFVVELLDTFLEEAPSMLAELRSALAERAAEPYRRTAHSLKTNAQTFGARQLAAQARAIELGGLPADTTDLDILDATYAATAAALRASAHG
jgi:histidine phosphotransfer protein HptB